MKYTNRVRLFLFCSGWKTRPLSGIIAFCAFTLGLSLSALCIQLALDLQNYVDGQNTGGSGSDYLVVSKDIGTMMLINPDLARFSAQDEQDLLAASFVKKIDRVLSNNFQSQLYFQLGDVNYATQLFFEAVPDSILGNVEGWKWSPLESGAASHAVVPILIPREFMSLYNLGFAPARNLPLIQDDLLGLIPLRLRAEGNSGSVEFDARIVGTTDKIASILVPVSFMEWANRNYSAVNRKSAQNIENNARRLIVSVDDEDNPAIETFLRAHAWKSDSASSGLRKASLLVNSLLTAVAAVGGLIMVLCLLVFFLKLRLFLHESSEDMLLLQLLGYRRNLLAFLSATGIAIPGFFSLGVSLVICIGASQALQKFLVSRLVEFESELRLLVIVVLSCMSLVPVIAQYLMVRNKLAISTGIAKTISR